MSLRGGGYLRTAVAAGLTVVAVAVPCAAWWLSGSSRLEREAQLRTEEVERRAEQKATRVAERIAIRLETLRATEDRRPFYHYQNLFHDPRGAAAGAAVSVSPLAQGMTDPLVEVHFQIDAVCSLTLPTINEDLPELALQTQDTNHCADLDRLSAVAEFCIRERPPELAGELAETGTVEEIDSAAWNLHLQANAVYADLKYAQSPGIARALEWKTDTDDAQRGDGADAPVRVAVGSFAWNTLPVGGDQALVALRDVATPVGVWTQGFVISCAAVEDLLADGEDTFRFEPTAMLRGGQGLVTASVAGTPWSVALDLGEDLAEATASASTERERFVGSFLLGVIAAGLASVLLVAMVWQSERLAFQRAQFAASAAHELRTPLAGLQLYGEMLADGLGRPERAREYARRIAGEAARLSRVVSNVLEFTRLERHVLKVAPRPGQLSGAVREAVERQRPMLEEAGAVLDLDLPENLPEVRFDPDAVSQIVQNLLDNAEKYTRDIPNRRILLRLEPSRGGVVLSVSDNGRGVPRELRRRLFRPFSRATDKDGPAGLGLGLVLVRALARAQGGDVAYRDAGGGGAELRVRFSG